MLQRFDTNKTLDISITIFLSIFVILTILAAYNLYRIVNVVSVKDTYTGHEPAISVVRQPTYRTSKKTNEISRQYASDCLKNCDEAIDETISRIKKNVVLTGTFAGTPGKGSAIFTIEGMPGKVFSENTQLMDGFIIKEISGTRVVLKNQIGDETFSLNVDNRYQGRIEQSRTYARR